MNVLVIGNGFDIEHELPTRYTDFLQWLIVLADIYDGIRSKESKNDLKERLKYDAKMRIDKRLLHENFIDRLIDVIDYPEFLANTRYGHISAFSIFEKNRHNMWYEYFVQKYLNRLYVEKERWIDFEAEITEIIGKIDVLFSNESGEKSINVDELLENNNPLQIIMEDKSSDSFSGDRERLIDSIEYGFNCFLEALHQFIIFIDNQFKINYKSPTIENVNAHKVLNFNYTNTYRKIYEPRMYDDDICFIHGKAEPYNGWGNIPIVLGGNPKKDTISSCCKLTKDYQRQALETDVSYKTWLDNNSVEHHLYIFGHSLGKIDADKLYELIRKSDSVTIYYYEDKNDKNYKELIENYQKNIYVDFGLNKQFKDFDEYCRCKNITFEKQKDKIRIK